jgi:Bacterial Ig domain
MLEKPRTRRWRTTPLVAALIAAALAPALAGAQPVVQSRGVDPRVDYPSLARLGPWDDRNYKLTADDLKVLAENESELKDPVPVFYRVELRRAVPGMLRTGPGQYPRSALQVFILKYGGYQVDGKLYREAVWRNGRFEVMLEDGITQEELEQRALAGDVRVTSPTGGAESTIEIHPTNVNRVIAGSNGPGTGQRMHFSTDGGSTWSAAAALPLGATCCDPTVDWSADGTKAYTATLGGCGAVCNVWVYRSDDLGQTWNGLESVTPGDPRRELTASNTSDKEFIHVDKHPSSPFKDNVYVTWHDSNVLKFSRSTDFANTFSANLTISSGTTESGIGSDITTDKSGNVYYFWPAFNSQRILVRKSTNGGVSFAPTVQVATTQDGFDFPIPSMETRRAFIYVAADADLTDGTFANSIYAAWTDTTAAASGTPANNHARIQVGFSRDGGATWTVTTPHSTANQTTVDRFHPWLAVGPDGKVYVLFYDTQRDPARLAVDIFYSISSDGAQTWSAPVRLTSVISPQIDTGFEWGDYNGLDVVGSQLLGIYTDNRNEAGGGADSVDVYAVGVQLGGGPGNNPPTVDITAPASGTTVTEGTSINFTGTASDIEDGDLTSGINWSSNVDGALGTGGSISVVLTVGVHTITASVTDSGSITATDIITVTVAGTGTATFVSLGGQDGYVTESGETTNQGGSASTTGSGDSGLRVGDTSADRQIKTIVSFNTSAIPDNATILSATLRLRRGSLTGTNPFTTHGTCRADISSAFAAAVGLAPVDFHAIANASGVATLSNPAANGDWAEGTLNAAGISLVNETGTTQFRVSFTLDDNDDSGNDYVGFFSGENATPANRPQLVVTYQTN